MFQHVTKCTTHFLLRKKEAEIKEEAGIYWKSLAVTVDEANVL